MPYIMHAPLSSHFNKYSIILGLTLVSERPLLSNALNCVFFVFIYKYNETNIEIGEVFVVFLGAKPCLSTFLYSNHQPSSVEKKSK